MHLVKRFILLRFLTTWCTHFFILERKLQPQQKNSSSIYELEVYWYQYVRINNYLKYPKPYLVREVLDRLSVYCQDDVSLSQQAALQRWLTWEETFDADHTAAVRPRVKLRDVKTEAEARQALLQHHLVRVF